MKLLKYVMLSAIALSCFSCSDDDDSTLRNDLIKKTVAPAIAGEKIEFAYAMGAQEPKVQDLSSTPGSLQETNWW